MEFFEENIEYVCIYRSDEFSLLIEAKGNYSIILTDEIYLEGETIEKQMCQIECDINIKYINDISFIQDLFSETNDSELFRFLLRIIYEDEINEIRRKLLLFIRILLNDVIDNFSRSLNIKKRIMYPTHYIKTRLKV